MKLNKNERRLIAQRLLSALVAPRELSSRETNLLKIHYGCEVTGDKIVGPYDADAVQLAIGIEGRGFTLLGGKQ